MATGKGTQLLGRRDPMGRAPVHADGADEVARVTPTRNQPLSAIDQNSLGQAASINGLCRSTRLG